ncbi:hypothetical protein EVAR_6749_1 [Eumeta japonica]|uniref:Uncharacterized protein n=1 Tax=Eumeta variegata TaxID=151549 RepID=A0A4C1V3P6_EUMVA|nr:hypothetical protein EVAR_6749_1 [Eumeta japonica]
MQLLGRLTRTFQEHQTDGSAAFSNDCLLLLEWYRAKWTCPGKKRMQSVLAESSRAEKHDVKFSVSTPTVLKQDCVLTVINKDNVISVRQLNEENRHMVVLRDFSSWAVSSGIYVDVGFRPWTIEEIYEGGFPWKWDRRDKWPSTGAPIRAAGASRSTASARLIPARVTLKNNSRGELIPVNIV